MHDSYDDFHSSVLEGFCDTDILRRWDEEDLLGRLRQRNKGRQKQVIHDVPRPPIEESTPRDLAHRIAKDIYFKAAALMGFNVSYLPSWNLFDPSVESDVVQTEHRAGNTTDAVKVRRQCKARVARRMASEKALLQRLGVFADWRGVRSQFESRYEARLLDGFGLLMERGYLSKEAKPSYWCVQCQTILTEDELRPKPRKSTAAYVRFPVRKGLEDLGTNVSLMVWVVELWALPAGIAIALPKEGDYVAVAHETGALIVERSTANRILADKPCATIRPIDATQLLQCTCSHPLVNAELPVVISDVQNGPKRGAGLFLAIPGHNQDDYVVRLEHNYRIVSIIDDEGRLTEDAERFCGLSVFEASEHIALQLDNIGFLEQMDTVENQYPHCWTCEMPAIFRPADQWLFDTRRHNLAERVVRDMRSLEAFPEHGTGTIAAKIEAKHKFGVSRQRVWGLPVPAFYCRKCGSQLDVDKGVKAVRDLISHKGTDAWFRMKADAILANDVSCAHCGERDFRKDTSILDPRMVTVLASLLNMEGRRESSAVGDIFLEPDEDALNWVVPMLLSLFATKEVLPMQFLHLQSPWLDPAVSDDSHLMTLLDDAKGGSDLFRLLVIRDPEEDSDDPVAHARAAHADVLDAMLYAAWVSRDAKLVTRWTSALPVCDGMFYEHFRTAAWRIATSYRNYRFLDAWKRVRRLGDDLRDYARIVEARGAASGERRGLAESLLRDCATQFAKLATPMVPAAAEHVWHTVWANADSIFLSDSSVAFDEGPPVLRVTRRDRPDGTFAEWLAVARKARDVAGGNGDPVSLVLDREDRRPLFAALVEDMAALAGVEVRLVEPDADPVSTGTVRLSEVPDPVEDSA